jgi:hypothetical protein
VPVLAPSATTIDEHTLHAVTVLSVLVAAVGFLFLSYDLLDRPPIVRRLIRVIVPGLLAALPWTILALVLSPSAQFGTLPIKYEFTNLAISAGLVGALIGLFVDRPDALVQMSLPFDFAPRSHRTASKQIFKVGRAFVLGCLCALTIWFIEPFITFGYPFHYTANSVEEVVRFLLIGGAGGALWQVLSRSMFGSTLPRFRVPLLDGMLGAVFWTVLLLVAWIAVALEDVILGDDGVVIPPESLIAVVLIPLLGALFTGMAGVLRRRFDQSVPVNTAIAIGGSASFGLPDMDGGTSRQLPSKPTGQLRGLTERVLPGIREYRLPAACWTIAWVAFVAANSVAIGPALSRLRSFLVFDRRSMFDPFGLLPSFLGAVGVGVGLEALAGLGSLGAAWVLVFWMARSFGVRGWAGRTAQVNPIVILLIRLAEWVEVWVLIPVLIVMEAIYFFLAHAGIAPPHFSPQIVLASALLAAMSIGLVSRWMGARLDGRVALQRQSPSTLARAIVLPVGWPLLWTVVWAAVVSTALAVGQFAYPGTHPGVLRVPLELTMSGLVLLGSVVTLAIGLSGCALVKPLLSVARIVGDNLDWPTQPEARHVVASRGAQLTFSRAISWREGLLLTVYWAGVWAIVGMLTSASAFFLSPLRSNDFSWQLHYVISPANIAVGILGILGVGLAVLFTGLFMRRILTWETSLQVKGLTTLGVILSILAFFMQLVEPTALLSYLPVQRGHSAPVLAVAWSPRGNRIASGGADNTVQVWAEDPQISVVSFQEHENKILSLAWSPDGTMIASGSANGLMYVWNARSAARISIAGNVHTPMYALAWAPNSDLIAHSADNGEVIVEHAHAPIRELLAILGYDHESGNVLAVAWSPDGRHVVSGSSDGEIRIWSIDSQALTLERAADAIQFKAHDGAVNAVVWSPDGTHLASAGADGTIRVWQVDTYTSAQMFRGHKGAVNAVAWSPDGTHLASAGADGTIRVWQVSTGATVMINHGHVGPVHALSWSPDDAFLVSAGEDREVQVCDAVNGDILYTYGPATERTA